MDLVETQPNASQGSVKKSRPRRRWRSSVAYYLDREKERLDYCDEMLGYMEALDYGDDDDDEVSGELLLRDYLVTVWLTYNWPELTDEQAELSANNGQLLQEPEPGNGQWPGDDDLAGGSGGAVPTAAHLRPQRRADGRAEEASGKS
ncbi:hypothetical protein MRX96_023710 [Rhipicephalus microplus]